RAELDPADRAGRQCFGSGGPLLAFGQVHVADGALLLAVIADDVGVHRAEILDIAPGRLILAVQWTRPLLVVVVDRRPEDNDQANSGHDGDEAQAGEDDFHDLPGLPPEASCRRRPPHGRTLVTVRPGKSVVLEHGIVLTRTAWPGDHRPRTVRELTDT